MAENSKIEWCRHTFNPWRGCSKVAEGCRFCYAEVDYSVKMHGIKWGPNGTRVKTSESYWRKPVKWNRDAQGASERPRVFCASLADVFEDWSGAVLNSNGAQLFTSGHGTYWTNGEYPGSRAATLDDLRRDLFALIDATPNLDWLLLTKRPENIRRMWAPTLTAEVQPREHFRHNVWLGTSIATQADADNNIPELLKCRDLSPVLFVSVEPLIEAVDLTRLSAPPEMQKSVNGGLAANALQHDDEHYYTFDASIDWLIVGGESGHNARPCEVSWIRSLVSKCKNAGVAAFVKQLGAHVLLTSPAFDPPFGCRWKLKDTKGGDWLEWPDDLRMRDFPRVEVPA